MLLSKRKIKSIQDLFKNPDKPTLININNQREDITRLSQINNSSKFSYPQKSKYKSVTEQTKKSSFPVYNTKTSSYVYNNIDNSTINNNYTYNTINTNNNYYDIYYPTRREIIIKNPEEIIESGIFKSKVRPEGVTSIYENINAPLPEVNNAPIQVQQVQQDINIDNSAQQNMEAENTIEPKNEMEETNQIPITETVKVEENENPPEEKAEEPPVEVIPEKKYKIQSGNIVSLPENYSTDDEEEFKAINTLNEDIGSWKKYTDKNGIKLYFKPYPVKDEKGNDAESVIGYCEAILDFPASKVIAKMNDFSFRQNVDENYKKGKLISESMEGNIKYMEMYLYMKMPFIFSDRDFVVKKKCWLDYNGNKDHALFFIHSVENPQFPPTKKLVRGTFENRSGYIKPLGDNQCQLNVVTAMDVKMSLGVSTMSKNGAEMQEKWISNLRKELAK